MYLTIKNKKSLIGILNQSWKKAIDLKGIKTKDGSRPNDVHIRAAVLLYKVYKEYGKEIIQQIIQIFTKLDNKTTENLLEAIKDNISLAVASFIENELQE